MAFRRTLLLLTFSLFLTVPAAGFGRDLSFKRARQLLYERNEALKAAAAQTESGREEENSLKWLHGPSIGIQATEVWATPGLT